MAAEYGFQEALSIVNDELLVQRKTQSLNVPAVMGPPGIGKTALALEAAILDSVVTFRPINVGDNSDPTDVTGTPVPAGILNNVVSILGDRATEDWESAMKAQGFSQADAESHVERIIWALNKASAEACMSPTMLFYDDFDKAPDSVQKGLIGLFGTRMFRDYKLHPLSLMMCAGNRVGDDLLAGDISQSILGRITVIQMAAKYEDFRVYAEANPGEIHPQVVGFLGAGTNKDLLFQAFEDGAYRAPSPRAWWEVGQHFYAFPDESKWTSIVERKCGTGVKNQWVAWHTILSKIDVPSILATGKADVPDGENPLMFQYATIFAVAKYIASNPIKRGWTGLEKFVKDLKGEYRIAMVIQIPSKKRMQLGRVYEKVGNLLIENLTDEEEDEEVTNVSTGV